MTNMSQADWGVFVLLAAPVLLSLFICLGIAIGGRSRD